jgi:hypothetical protein
LNDERIIDLDSVWRVIAGRVGQPEETSQS